MNGAPLPVQHGFPVRLVVPGWYGMAHVKWLRAVTVTAEPFTGFQNAVAYRFKEHPDSAGELEGRAWSGCAAVVRVEVSTDGGGTWGDADLGPALGRWAWSRWTYRWRADEPGRYELLARAHDADGHVQPVDQPWNVQGMANNMAQRVSVVVAGAAARRRTPRPPV